jgi:peptide/nickel transport system substrate-binding protein
MEVEADKTRRDELIRQATKIYLDDYAFVPIHQQAVVWVARQNIDLFQSPDDYFHLRMVKMR